MRRIRLTRDRLPAFAFLASALLLAGALLLNQSLARDAQTGYSRGEFHLDGDRAGFSISLPVSRGDRVLLQPQVPLGERHFGPHDFYITPAGGADALLAGQAPDKVYLHLPSLPSGGCCVRYAFSFERPDGGAGSSEEIELVWVYHYLPGAAPETPDEEAVLRDLYGDVSRTVVQQVPWWPTVVPRHVVAMQPVLFGVEVAAGVAACLSAVAYLWVLHRRTASPPQGATGTEALLGLHRAAGAHLLGFRDLLVGGLLSFILVLLAFATWNATDGFLSLGARGAFGPWVKPVVEGTLLALIAVLLAGWLFLLLHVHRALRRWRRRAALPPLDL
jgi:hypothetical protein